MTAWTPIRRGVFSCAVLALLSACASNDYVVFVTKTSVSVLDADTTPPSISVAYDRTEGVVSPTFSGGHAPSVLAHISSDGNVWNPKIRQAYATGDAARLLVGEGQDGCILKSEPGTAGSGELYPMLFATHTVAGLKLEFAQTGGPSLLPSGLVFGFRRKEASAIRVTRVPSAQLAAGCQANNGAEHVFYPPVLASIELRAKTQPDDTALENCQFFATGDAARGVARAGLDELSCNKLSSRAFGKYYETKGELQTLGLQTLACYVRTRPEQRPQVWRDVSRLALWGDLSEAERDPKSPQHPERIALGHFEKSKFGGESARREQAAADRVYTSSVGVAGSQAGFESGRARAMQAHKQLVCDLASQ